MGRLVERTVSFEYPADLRAGWHSTMPELACVANAVSLMMPYLEPYVVRAVREALPHLEPELAVEARAYIAQEAQHHTQHRRFNELIAAQVRGVGAVESMLRRTFDRLWRTRSERFHLAYAAAAEAGAYGVARWVERHHAELFRDADPTVASLYLWHLAEEVEHKAVAYDVFEEVDGSRRRYLGAGLCSLALLAGLTVLATLAQLWASRRIWSPVAWFRLTRWSISLAFEVLPDLFVAATPGHHPSQFSDPTLLVAWLRNFDPSTGQDPLAAPPGPTRP